MSDITPKELKKKLEEKGDILLIDVREPYEHEEYNIGGRLIPLGEFAGKLFELEDSRNAEIVVYCRSGNRSGMAQHLMLNFGFENVHNLAGGMEAWKNEFDA